jgi:hypothetical protein
MRVGARGRAWARETTGEGDESALAGEAAPHEKGKGSEEGGGRKREAPASPLGVGKACVGEAQAVPREGGGEAEGGGSRGLCR